MNKNKKSNRLISEGSPYLLQHAYNPVDWYTWSEEAFQAAKQLNKPIIVSIGYSACHWCHVMEHESFENDAIAAVMNEHFISIKIDREERPDVDQIYMDALHAMGLRGGWPLNVFLTPDGQPFYGGTYFPPQHWKNLLLQISNAYETNYDELITSAQQFTEAIQKSDVHKYRLTQTNVSFSTEEIKMAFHQIAPQFDKTFGGLNKAPKFPMPSIYHYLLRDYKWFNRKESLEQVELTLQKMAMGGIYDSIAGGFARYSVDGEWFAPHFEKMLYDNAQLLSLYSEVYLITKNPFYKDIILETTQWIKNEMLAATGGVMSALDADSEGVEGKFYCWTYNELVDHFYDDFELLCDYYSIVPEGNWEHGMNILYRKMSDEVFAQKHSITIEQLKSYVKKWKSILFVLREPKERPGLDDKIIVSWNGMLIKGMVDAFHATQEKYIYDMAIQLGEFILQLMDVNGKLVHSIAKGKVNNIALLEDYAYVIQGFLALYEITQNEQWIIEATELCNQAVDLFFDETEGMFFYTSAQSDLIARKKEIFDNVIPASNSSMARNLYALGKILSFDEWLDLSQSMASRMYKAFLVDPSYLSNWGCLIFDLSQPTAEIMMVGNEVITDVLKCYTYYYPNKIICTKTNELSNIPMLQDKPLKVSTTHYYWCENKTCGLPMTNISDILSKFE
jgi:uncharacterized protein YyaL (SSP411 family)